MKDDKNSSSSSPSGIKSRVLSGREASSTYSTPKKPPRAKSPPTRSQLTRPESRASDNSTESRTRSGAKETSSVPPKFQSSQQPVNLLNYGTTSPTIFVSPLPQRPATSMEGLRVQPSQSSVGQDEFSVVSEVPEPDLIDDSPPKKTWANRQEKDERVLKLRNAIKSRDESIQSLGQVSRMQAEDYSRLLRENARLVLQLKQKYEELESQRDLDAAAICRRRQREFQAEKKAQQNWAELVAEDEEDFIPEKFNQEKEQFHLEVADIMRILHDSGSWRRKVAQEEVERVKRIGWLILKNMRKHYLRERFEDWVDTIADTLDAKKAAALSRFLKSSWQKWLGGLRWQYFMRLACLEGAWEQWLDGQQMIRKQIKAGQVLCNLKMKQAWNSWVELHFLTMDLKDRLKRGKDKFEGYQKRRVLRVWLAEALRGMGVEELSAIMKKMDLHRKARAFRIMKMGLEKMRVQMEAAEEKANTSFYHVQDIIFVGLFKRWIVETGIPNQYTRKLCHHLRYRILHEVKRVFFNLWDEFMDVRRAEKQRLQIDDEKEHELERVAVVKEGRVVFNHMKAAFRRLADYLDREKSRQGKVRKSLRRRRSWVKWACVHHWWEYTTSKAEGKRFLRRSNRIFNFRKLNYIFRPWAKLTRENVRRARLLEVCVRRMRMVMLGYAFDSWWDTTQEMLGKKRRIRQAVRWMENRTLARAFNTWQNLQLDIAAAREKAERMVYKMKNANLLWAFAAWKSALDRKKDREQIFQNALQKVKMAYRLQHPEEFEGGDKTLRERKMFRFAQHWAQHRLSNAFNDWKRFASEQKEHKALGGVDPLQAHVKVQGRKADTHPSQGAVLSQRARDNKLNYAVAKMAKAFLWKAFNTWVTYMQVTRYELLREHFQALADNTRDMLLRPLSLVIRGRRDAQLEKVTGFPVERPPLYSHCLLHDEAYLRGVKEQVEKSASLKHRLRDDDEECEEGEGEDGGDKKKKRPSPHVEAVEIICAELEFLRREMSGVRTKTWHLKQAARAQLVEEKMQLEDSMRQRLVVAVSEVMRSNQNSPEFPTHVVEALAGMSQLPTYSTSSVSVTLPNHKSTFNSALNKSIEWQLPPSPSPSHQDTRRLFPSYLPKSPHLRLNPTGMKTSAIIPSSPSTSRPQSSHKSKARPVPITLMSPSDTRPQSPRTPPKTKTQGGTPSSGVSQGSKSQGLQSQNSQQSMTPSATPSRPESVDSHGQPRMDMYVPDYGPWEGENNATDP